jgi:cell division septal protein FtsQ
MQVAHWYGMMVKIKNIRPKTSGRKGRLTIWLFKLFILSASFAILIVFAYPKIEPIIIRTEKIYHSEIIHRFKVEQIEVIGSKVLSENDVIDSSGIELKTSMFDVDVNMVRQKLESNPWIESVSVGKIFPSTVKVIIEESIPQAIWFNNEKFYLIGRTGKVISNISENPISNEYILVFGDDAPQLYANIYYKLREHSLAKNLLALSSLQGRRWDLYLKDGLLIKLPEVDVEKALIILDKLNKNGMIINGGIDELDLRLLPEKIFVKRKK